MKKIYVSILFTVAFLNSNFYKAQNQLYKESSISQLAESWNPIKLDEAGNNILNGVHIFQHNTECNSEKVRLIKLVNVNAYPVKFNYQLSESSNAVSVVVPASFSIEGSCSTLDSELKKLVFVIPEAKTEEVFGKVPLGFQNNILE